MQQLYVRQTSFHVEPLKNIVGVDKTAAYRIVVRPGPALGSLGVVQVPAYALVCNDDAYQMNTVDGSGSAKWRSWLKSVLATFKS